MGLVGSKEQVATGSILLGLIVSAAFSGLSLVFHESKKKIYVVRFTHFTTSGDKLPQLQ